MLMLYSILNKLDFENMAQNLIFLLSQCPGATQQKIEFFLKVDDKYRLYWPEYIHVPLHLNIYITQKG